MAGTLLGDNVTTLSPAAMLVVAYGAGGPAWATAIGIRNNESANIIKIFLEYMSYPLVISLLSIGSEIHPPPYIKGIHECTSGKT